MMLDDPGGSTLGALTAYNLAQNLIIPERAYVPANLAMAAGLVALARRSDLSFEAMGLGRGQLRKGFLVGSAVGGSMAAAIALAASGRFDRWFLDERARGHGRGESAYRVAVRFPIGTALFEEVAFRGVLDGLLRRSAGDPAARAATAAAFGAWHLVPTFRFFPDMGAARGAPSSVKQRTLAALSGAILTGLSGFGFTVLRERTGSVAAPWLVHSAVNASSYLSARKAWLSSDHK
jgi:membrane protease YdiL (CAAX protease family)